MSAIAATTDFCYGIIALGWHDCSSYILGCGGVPHFDDNTIVRDGRLVKKETP